MRPTEPVGALDSFSANIAAVTARSSTGTTSIDHSDLEGAFSRDGFAGHKQFGGELFAYRTREKVGPAAIRR